MVAIAQGLNNSEQFAANREKVALFIQETGNGGLVCARLADFIIALLPNSTEVNL